MFIRQGIKETEQGEMIVLDVDGQILEMTVPVAEVVRRVLGRLISEVEERRGHRHQGVSARRS